MPQDEQPTVEGEVLYCMGRSKVVRLGKDRVVKSAPDLRIQEADTLRFIAANTTIPVPKVHDVHWKDGKVAAIVMDYMPGQQLDKAWANMNHDQKLSVTRELHGYVSQLRNLKGDYIGGLNHGKAIIGKYVTIECGPFNSEKLFNEFLVSDISPKAPEMLLHYARHALDDNHEIVFTHSDLAPRNILVNEGRITAILDWELAGWYPEYYEYIKTFQDWKPMPDWPEYLYNVLPPRYEKEYIGYFFLTRLSGH
ncbi:hypothetical protein ACJ72_07068 [Emergomyces africanus]|uniref:non-specific serine/threonine protein kinase n=1 Tax=Emergomyces africanus TaxID=1955775 RepID=A0A1B7NP84_9EURO|nr:hypothetical protein ACJ72_07068 [Emergomyces africanus]